MRLQQHMLASATGDAENRVNELHIRASQWYEDHDLEIEAFQHAAAASDIERAERLIQGKGIPLHLRGAVTAILDWLGSLPRSVLDARPSLWVRYASLLLVSGQTTGVEEKLQGAESALALQSADHADRKGTDQASKSADQAGRNRTLVGQIAAARATLALTRYQVEAMITQSRRALENLRPDHVSFRTALWTLGFANQLQGDRAAASRAYGEAVSISQAAGDIFTTILATIGLGNMQEADNQLPLAAETYRRVLQLAGDPPQQVISEAHLGLARIFYQWNDLDAAEQHARQGLHLARQYDVRVIDRFIVSEVFLARLRLARGDAAGASAILAQAAQWVRQNHFALRMPEVAAAQVLTLITQGRAASGKLASSILASSILASAADLAQTYELPISQARVHLAQGNPSAALEILASYRRQVEAKGWEDERLQVLVLQAVALLARGEKDPAAQALGDALALAEPGGFIRIFVDEGAPMAQLLSEASAPGPGTADYVVKLRAALAAEAEPLLEALSPARVGSSPADCPGALEPGDQRAAFPGPGYSERAQPQNL